MDIASIQALLKDSATYLKDAGTGIEAFGKAGTAIGKIFTQFDKWGDNDFYIKETGVAFDGLSSTPAKEAPKK